MTNSKKVIKKKVGRPTVMVPEVVAKLESIYKLDVTDDVACDYAGIDEATLYRHLEKNDVFARNVRSWKKFGRIAAGNVVMDSIVKDKDVVTAKWWLEKKAPKEFGNRPEVAIQQNIGFQLTDEQVKRIIEG